MFCEFLLPGAYPARFFALPPHPQCRGLKKLVFGLPRELGSHKRRLKSDADWTFSQAFVRAHNWSFTLLSVSRSASQTIHLSIVCRYHTPLTPETAKSRQHSEEKCKSSLLVQEEELTSRGCMTCQIVLPTVKTCCRSRPGFVCTSILVGNSTPVQRILPR